VTQPRTASVYSLATLTRLADFRIAHVPRPSNSSGARPAAVAGKFYPADAKELNRLVDRCLSGEPVKPLAVPAVMAPHAGLIYSGRVAGEVFRRVQFPKTIIVIGPKHTRHGVEWAVAPHDAWSIPGGTVPAYPQLARELCAGIPGLELDAAAHAQEHAIEVELPFLARLAPESRVVGIVIGAGDLARCREFATGLANVLRQLPERPLLVISSDMNHFASDAETRRLDDIALRALETLDPAVLYETVTGQHISMCGLLPAVIVLETLRQLGSLNSTERIAYATSADVTGDTSRVVGYSGVFVRG
jgi:AmmeMemoRadiSam system protein B